MAIDKTILFQTAGKNSDISQIFYNNSFVNISEAEQEVIAFDLPIFSTIGGTTDYYGQSVYAIFTNLANPFIRFIFTGNTSSFGLDTSLIHDFYRLDFEVFSGYNPNFLLNSLQQTQQNSSSVETITTTDGSGNVSTNTIQKNLNTTNNLNDFDNMGLTKLSDIQNILENPLFSLTASTTGITTGITTSIYDLILDEYVKPTNGFKTLLFQDKAQFFVDTRVRFKITKDNTLLDFDTINGQNLLVTESAYNSEEFIVSDSLKSNIIAGDFKGIKVVGNFFTYFTVPNKPKIEFPVLSGTIQTFTPTVYFSNVEDGDEYLMQITYTTGDTGFTTGTIFSYPIPKEDKFKEESINVNTDSTTTKKVRRFETVVKSNMSFRYRIGNIKSIKNIFGVKQSVVTFSDSLVVTTNSAPVQVFVGTESDSPYVNVITGYLTSPYLDVESPSGIFVLSGMVSGSTVTGATMQLVYPNGSYIIQSTDETGLFSFENLESGLYTLNTFYRGYKDDSRSVNLTGDTSLGFKINLLWSNQYDTWGKMANENFFI